MSDQKTWQPTPEQMAEIMNLDGLLSRGQIHPVDYVASILNAGPDWQSIATDLACAMKALQSLNDETDPFEAMKIHMWCDAAIDRYYTAGEKLVDSK